MVQTPPPKSTYQETVITNAESMETKQTKKRKAVNAANAAAEYVSTTPPASVIALFIYLYIKMVL